MDIVCFEDLYKLFPKYLYEQEHKIGIIYFRNYRWHIFSPGNIDLKGLQDVYDSINYIEDFLKLNEFILIDNITFWNIKLNIRVLVYHSYYRLFTSCGFSTYDSETLIYKLKEILDIVSLNKPIINY